MIPPTGRGRWRGRSSGCSRIRSRWRCSRGSTRKATASVSIGRRTAIRWCLRRRASPSVLKGMAAALEQARRAAAQDEVPIGAVVMRGDEIIGSAHNETVARSNPTSHAEFLAIERALEALATDRLTDCTLYVTLEPCAQCAGAIVLAKVGKLVFGAYDEKAGMCGSVGDLVRHPRLNHRVDVQSGVEAEACGELLREFFAAKR